MTKQNANKFSPEVRARAVRMVLDHEAEHPSPWQAIVSIAAEIGCLADSVNEWLNEAEVKADMRADVTRVYVREPKAIERDSRELWQANEIPCKASAYFAWGSSTAGRRHDRAHR